MCSVIKELLKILQNSQKNMCAGVARKDTLAQVFSHKLLQIFQSTCIGEHQWTTDSVQITDKS